MIKKIKAKYENGFSLMEVLVAIFIIMTALVGIMTLIGLINASASGSTSRLIAVNLAQEGMEIVKNIRDLNYAADSDGNGYPDYTWDNWYDSFSGVNERLVQYGDTALRSFNDTSLKFNSVTGLYGYDSGIATPFAYKRKIILTKNPSGSDDNEIKIEVVVSWIEHNRSQSLTVEDRLWNWR